MNRRNFLQWLGLATTAAAGLVLDPDRLLWVPKAKTIFIPKLVAIRKRLPSPTLVELERYTLTRLRILEREWIPDYMVDDTTMPRHISIRLPNQWR